MSVFYFDITPSGNFHFIMKDKKRNRGYLSCLKDRCGKKSEKSDISKSLTAVATVLEKHL